jgi:hypothetical protein
LAISWEIQPLSSLIKSRNFCLAAFAALISAMIWWMSLSMSLVAMDRTMKAASEMSLRDSPAKDAATSRSAWSRSEENPVPAATAGASARPIFSSLRSPEGRRRLCAHTSLAETFVGRASCFSHAPRRLSGLDPRGPD